MGQKKFWVDKNVWVKKFWVKNFLGQKNFWVKIFFWVLKILGQKFYGSNIFGQKDLDPISFCLKKKTGRVNLSWMIYDTENGRVKIVLDCCQNPNLTTTQRNLNIRLGLT